MIFFKRSILMWVLSAAAASAVHGQSAPPPRAATSQPVAHSTPSLTPAELAKVKTILAPYKPARLTTDDAKLIKRTLRDAGMRRSHALDAALIAAGFSPEKLDQLDPPPPRPSGERSPPLPR